MTQQHSPQKTSESTNHEAGVETYGIREERRWLDHPDAPQKIGFIVFILIVLFGIVVMIGTGWGI